MGNDGETNLETARLILEPLRHDHAQQLFPVLSDTRIYTYIPQDAPASAFDLETRYRRLESRRSPAGDELWLNWAILLKQLERYVGTIQATLRPDGSSLLAYELSPNLWGQGVATEACSRVIESLFLDYDVEEVLAEVDTRNTASIRLLERLSFRRVLTKAGVDFFKGMSSDEYTYKLSRRAGAAE